MHCGFKTSNLERLTRHEGFSSQAKFNSLPTSSSELGFFLTKEADSQIVRETMYEPHPVT